MNILSEEQYSCIILAIKAAGKSYKKKHAYHADLAEIVGKLFAGKRDSGVIILANRSLFSFKMNQNIMCIPKVTFSFFKLTQHLLLFLFTRPNPDDCRS